VAAAVTLITVLWIGVVSQVRFERAQAMAEATERQANLAIAFEEYSLRTLDNANAVIRYILRELGHTTGPIDMPRLLSEIGISQDTFDAVSVVDRTGTVSSTSSDSLPAMTISIADRAHFQVHQRQDIGGLFIGQPVLSRRTDTMMVPITHRINTPDGQFAGVVSVQFSPSQFTAFYGTATVGERDVFSLVGLDGVTRARRVGSRESTGEDIGGSVLFDQLRQRPTGTYVGPGRLDGIERLYAFRQLRQYPLVVTVGVTTADILADATARRRWYFASAAAVSGGLIAFAGFLSVSLTRRRRIFDALSASQSRLQALFKYSTEAILLSDDQTRFIDANPAACALVGYTRDELLGLRAEHIYPPELRPHLPEHWQALMETGRASGEMPLVRKDGAIRDVDFNAVAHIEAGVHLTVFRDVTERKRLERSSLRAQRMDSIGTLAGGIAHDLNNALAPILMSIAMLQEDETDPGRRDMLNTINISAQRGADMVRQLLSFARGVEGRRVPVAIDQVIRDIERIANDTFFKTIRVQVTIADPIPSIVGDPTQLHQVLLNLCLNARDAMPTGGTLTISAERTNVDALSTSMQSDTRPGAYVVVAVSDSGTGISAEVQERIFEPFFTTKSLGKGTGLGLSTSLAIVESHHGFIRVYSEAGRGTTFTVFLPIRDDADRDPLTANTSEMPRGNGELILIIDDETSVREVTKRTLEAFGYRAMVAADGTLGAEAYAVHHADVALVITDMMMPGMDGPATMAALKTINPDVRIIAASGLAEESRVARALEAGALLVLSKPFTAGVLLRTLRDLLRPE
jgi:PAS domain S-box-containing protein